MGKHTAYWQDYSKSQARRTLTTFLVIIGWVAAAGLAAFANELLGVLFPFVLVVVFLGLVVSCVLLGRSAYDVTCPECGATYRRSKWGGQCPSCGLRLLQQDP